MNACRRFALLLLALTFLFAPRAICADQPAGNSPAQKIKATRIEKLKNYSLSEDWAAETLTGNWNGARDRLDRGGFEITLNSISDFQGNPAGGQRQVVGFFQRNTLKMSLDMERLVGWEAAEIYWSGVWQYGDQISQNDIPNFMNISSVAGFNNPMINQYGLKQGFGDGVGELLIGKIAMQDEFALMDYYNYFVNNTFGNPQIIGNLNAPFTPNGQPGARLRLNLPGDFYLMTGAYSGTPNVFDRDPNGLEFMFNQLVTGYELGYKIDEDNPQGKLPRHYKIGAIYNFGDYTPYLSTQSGTGNYLVYAMMSQYVWRQPDPRHFRGLAVAAAILHAPGDRNQAEWQGQLNLLYKGLIPCRPDDFTGIGFAVAEFSSDYSRSSVATGGPAASREILLEFTHKIRVWHGFHLQPDIQYIITPNGNSAVDNALVLGLRGILDF